jgi:3-phosphoglycerate kinase
MAFSFLVAQGFKVGTSLLGESQVDIVAGYPDQAARAGTEIVLPSDVIVAAEPAADTPHEVVAVDAILADRLGLDIGPESARFSPPASSGPIRFLEWPRWRVRAVGVCRWHSGRRPGAGR